MPDVQHQIPTGAGHGWSFGACKTSSEFSIVTFRNP
jgi:hypothetical protein